MPPATDELTGRQWVIVLKTFDDDYHQQAAENMLADLPRVAPDLAQAARTHTTSNGSMVLYGQYDGPDDANARNDLERIREMTIRGRRVFARVMLVPIDFGSPGRDSLHPYDLRTARIMNPNVDPLYTLDVAVWMDPEMWDENAAAAGVNIRQEAERYATSLRTQGHEAYFYHDPARGLSTVTVGLFSSNAIADASTGILVPAVEAMRDQFTPRLANGEPLYQVDIYEYKARGKKPDDADLIPQKPQLVVVPE